MQRSSDFHRSRADTSAYEAVTRFGQTAVDKQTTWVVPLKHTECFLGDGVIILHQPSPKASHQHPINQQYTCALPCCPDFNQPLRTGDTCFSVEQESRFNLSDKHHRQPASLAKVRASPISGEENLRGRGKTGCFHFHLACGERLLSTSSKNVYTDQTSFVQLPTASLPLGDYAHKMRLRPHAANIPGNYRQLDPPNIHCIYKWIAIIQAELDLMNADKEAHYIKDDGLAA